MTTTEVLAEVMEIRKELFETLFGPVPEDIFYPKDSLQHLWPSGLYLQIPDSKLSNLCFTSSFGLTNPHIPGPVVETSSKQLLGGFLTIQKAESTTTRDKPGRAGCGYEMVIP